MKWAMEIHWTQCSPVVYSAGQWCTCNMVLYPRGGAQHSSHKPGWTDGHNLTYYLPCFVVDNKAKVWSTSAGIISHMSMTSGGTLALAYASKGCTPIRVFPTCAHQIQLCLLIYMYFHEEKQKDLVCACWTGNTWYQCIGVCPFSVCVS